MSYVSNPQLYNANEALNASNNAPDLRVIADQARSLVSGFGPEINFGLQQILNRTHGANPEGQLKVVREALKWAQDRVADAKAEVDRLNAIEMARRAAAGAAIYAVHARQSWATRHAAPFWQAGGGLAAIAAKIAATRPTGSNLAGLPPTAVLGDDVDLSAALDVAEAGLAKVTAQIKAIRADVKARAKAAS